MITLYIYCFRVGLPAAAFREGGRAPNLTQSFSIPEDYS